MRAFMRRPAGRAADRRLLVPDTSDSMIVLYVPAVSVCLSPRTLDSSDRQIPNSASDERSPDLQLAPILQ